jgi:hypothetical protein
MDMKILKNEIKNLSQASYRPIEFSDNNEKIKSHIAIWNNNNQAIESVQSKHYRIVQHHEAFSPIADVIENAGISKNFYGRIQEYSGKAFMKLAFPELKFTPADGKEVYMGFVAKNSYNGTSGVWIGGFGMRTCCENQMVIKNLIVGTSIRHIGETDVTKEIAGFVLEVGERIPIIQKAIDTAIGERMSIEQAKMEMTELKFGQKRTDILAAKFELGEQNRWSLYNVITEYASHEEKRPATENRLLALASEILVRKVA